MCGCVVFACLPMMCAHGCVDVVVVVVVVVAVVVVVVVVAVAVDVVKTSYM